MTALLLPTMVSFSVGEGEDAADKVAQILQRMKDHDFSKNSGYLGVGDMTDEAWKVRLLAIRDLVRLGESGVSSIRENLANSKWDSSNVRHVCVMALGILGAKDAAPDLVRILENDDHPVVRGQAAQALGEIGYTEGKELLTRISQEDASKHVRHRAELALGRLEQRAFADKELAKKWASLDEKTFNQVEVGKPAPDFELRDTDGKTWRLSDFKNEKGVLLIWIFADWCPVCQVEFAHLLDSKERFAKNNVQVFTIECHDKYRCGRMSGGRDVGIWWPHLVDATGSVAAMYNVAPMEFIVHDEWINRPSTIYVDKEGVVRFAYYGTYWGDRPTIEQTLEMLETDTFSFVHPERRKP